LQSAHMAANSSEPLQICQALFEIQLISHFRGYSSANVQQVLVLNASYEPLNVCSLRRAHVLVYKGKAEVVEELDKPLRSATDTYRWPHTIRLVYYVRVPRLVQRKISPPAPFARDCWRC